MVTYKDEKASVNAEIKSMKKAADFIQSEIKNIQQNMEEDFDYTKEKILEAYEKGLNFLQRQEKRLDMELNKMKSEEHYLELIEKLDSTEKIDTFIKCN